MSYAPDHRITASSLQSSRHTKNGRWWRWFLVVPAAGGAYYFMSRSIAGAIEAMFPNTQLLLNAGSGDAEPLGMGVARALATFYGVMAGAYAAPKRHFATSVVISVPGAIVALVSGGLLAFLLAGGQSELGAALARTIEGILGPIMAAIACLVVYRAERADTGQSRNDGVPAWKGIGLTLLGVLIGVPLLWGLNTLGYNILLWIVGKLSSGLAVVLMWVFTVAVFVPLMVQLHVFCGAMAVESLRRLPSRLTAASLIVIGGIMNVSAVIMRAIEFSRNSS